MKQKQLFSIVRAAGAMLCIVTLNAILILSHMDADASVPRWSIYMLIVFSGGLLGLDALVNAPWAPGGDQQ